MQTNVQQLSGLQAEGRPRAHIQRRLYARDEVAEFPVNALRNVVNDAFRIIFDLHGGVVMDFLLEEVSGKYPVAISQVFRKAFMPAYMHVAVTVEELLGTAGILRAV